jgi:hypothetical protein
VARINIEDSLWKDERFQDLMIKTGNRHTAKGMLVELWALAQEYWFPERKLIPLERIHRSGLGLMLEVGLAVDKECGIFAIGTEKAFDWLFQAQERGKASAKARKKKSGTSQPKSKASQTKSKATDTDRSSSSYSSSFSLSSSDSSSNSPPGGNAPAEAPASADAINPRAQFIGIYVKAYQARYGKEARPDLSGKVQGAIGRFLGDDSITFNRACALIQTYCQMSDSWFLTKCHDFETFMGNLGKVGLALDTGKTMTQTAVRQADKTAHAQDQLRRIASGEL